ncbi:60S ribosomal protein L7-1 [Prosopis cineraria]|uniref:60S ribosomal protein L7-1 n=1 Tax=Prosopis cineraria TaxID=364024 RepID=UPI00240FEEEF|nr:60S ribosomal protein L7-1 [Prosopis cineraria]
MTKTLYALCFLSPLASLLRRGRCLCAWSSPPSSSAFPIAATGFTVFIPETMAEEEPKPLNYIPETILKKRKSSEALALRKRDQLQQKKFQTKNSKDYVKKPEDFIIEYRNKELDLVRMKRRVKRIKKQPELLMPNSNSKLLLIIRIQGKNDMHPKTRKVLDKLNLKRVFNAVFVKASVGIMAKLQRVEPYVTYGYPNIKSIKELIYKKGFAKLDNQKVPLTDNNIIEQALGKYGIVCMEDMVHEIVNVGPHFEEVASFLWPFELSKPADGLRGSKTLYKDGGDTGNREDLINELIDKMN